MKGMTVKFAFGLNEEVVDESPTSGGKIPPHGMRGKIVGASITPKGIFYSIESRGGRRFQAKEEALTAAVDYDKAVTVKAKAEAARGHYNTNPETA